MKPRLAFLSCSAAVGLLLACDKTPEPAAEHATTTQPHSAVPRVSAPGPAARSAGAAAAASSPNLAWHAPSRWVQAAPKSRMRVASYTIPKAKGDAEDGELAVFYFGPNDGGGVEANMKRWIDQFSGVEPTAIDRSERSVAGLKQHHIEIAEGTFSSGMPGGPTQPKPGFALLGAIVESPSGSYFFKLTGPKSTVQAARPEFRQMLDSVALKKE